MTLHFKQVLQIGRFILDFEIGQVGLRAFLHILGAKEITVTVIKGYLEKEIETHRVASVTGVAIYQAGDLYNRHDLDEPKPWVFAWGVHFAEGDEYPVRWRLT